MSTDTAGGSAAAKSLPNANRPALAAAPKAAEKVTVPAVESADQITSGQQDITNKQPERAQEPGKSREAAKPAVRIVETISTPVVREEVLAAKEPSPETTSVLLPEDIVVELGPEPAPEPGTDRLEDEIAETDEPEPSLDQAETEAIEEDIPNRPDYFDEDLSDGADLLQTDESRFPELAASEAEAAMDLSIDSLQEQTLELFENLEPEAAGRAEELVSEIIELALQLEPTSGETGSQEVDAVESAEAQPDDNDERLQELCAELFALAGIEADQETLQAFVSSILLSDVERPAEDDSDSSYYSGTRERKLLNYLLVRNLSLLMKQPPNVAVKLGRYILSTRSIIQSQPVLA